MLLLLGNLGTSRQGLKTMSSQCVEIMFCQTFLGLEIPKSHFLYCHCCPFLIITSYLPTTLLSLRDAVTSEGTGFTMKKSNIL